MANKTSKGQEGYYARYKSSGQFIKNRRLKLERVLKKQPNNEQVKQALKDIHYRRKAPKTVQWSKTRIREAVVAKLFSRAKPLTVDPKSPQVRQPFSILARVTFK
jgi:hypothetical protein